MKKILVVGSGGMLGHDVVDVFQKQGNEVTCATRQDFDIVNLQEVEKFFCDKQFDLVVNCAAYTQVDKAEEEPDLAFAVNETGAKNLAIVTNQSQTPIVYVSTDYVFDGTKNSPYLVTDQTNPINIYGKSKRAGEVATMQHNPKHYIARTSWLYGIHGKNFVKTMLNLATTRNEISVVNNQHGCPTWTYNLARDIENLFSNKSSYAVYHLCGAQSCSWYEFALTIFKVKNINISLLPILDSQFPSLAKRPQYSIMKSNSSSDLVGDLEGYFMSLD